MSDTKPTNPKDQIAVTKVPLHLVPGTMKVLAALAFAEGAAKYGAYNWRLAGVRASVYKSALERHMEKWWNGEDHDPVTGVPHLASMLACIGIIADARLCGKLTDDRPPRAPVGPLIDQNEESIKSINALFDDRRPYHFTIADSDVSNPIATEPPIRWCGSCAVQTFSGVPRQSVCKNCGFDNGYPNWRRR